LTLHILSLRLLLTLRVAVFKPGHYKRLCGRLRSEAQHSRMSVASQLTIGEIDDMDLDDDLHPL